MRNDDSMNGEGCMKTDDAMLDRRAFLASATGAFAAFGGLTTALDGLRLPPRSVGPRPQSRPFEIVVIGDSIMWGQGLSDDPAKNQKFTFKVQRFVQEKLPGTEVHLHNFAHSGAQILANPSEDSRKADHGEIPNYFPSITWQLGRAVTELGGGAGVDRRYVPQLHPIVRGDGVDLVLMDGGINDFGTKKILTPDPSVDADWVRKITREQCVARMQSLLPKVMTAFPNAKIVVTNYFPIVSEQSEPVYLWELLRAWEIIGPVLEYAADPLMKKLTAQATAFHTELTRGLETVVANARPLQVSANASSTQTSRIVAAGGTRAVGLPDPTPRRVVFVDVGFGAENAYAAPDTNLFYLNEPDPAGSARKEACLAKYGVLNPNCSMAAGGHPNLKGAAVYADAIISALGQLYPAWGSGKTDIRTAPPIVRPPIRRP